MIDRPYGHGLVVLGGELHSVGGQERERVEKYDAATNTWIDVPAMRLGMHNDDDDLNLYREQDACVCSTNSDL